MSHNPIVLRMRNVVCALGHTSRAMECPACGEAARETAPPEHWRWYRGRTSSKRIREAVDVILRIRTASEKLGVVLAEQEKEQQ